MTTKRVNTAVNAHQYLNKLLGKLTFSRMLKATRLADEHSQEEFAKLLGISKQHLSDIERGRKVVSPERAYRWAKKLGYHELQWAQLALQDALDKANLRVTVHLQRAA